MGALPDVRARGFCRLLFSVFGGVVSGRGQGTGEVLHCYILMICCDVCINATFRVRFLVLLLVVSYLSVFHSVAAESRPPFQSEPQSTHSHIYVCICLYSAGRSEDGENRFRVAVKGAASQPYHCNKLYRLTLATAVLRECDVWDGGGGVITRERYRFFFCTMS